MRRTYTSWRSGLVAVTAAGAIFSPAAAIGQGLGAGTGTGTSAGVGGAASAASSLTSGTGTLVQEAVQRTDNLMAQVPTNPSSTIIPTDTLPLPAVQNRLSFAENLQLRILQKLPARFYFNSTCETSVRYETNPFQFPKKRSLLHQLPPPALFRLLNGFQQVQIYELINLANNDDVVFRVLPNVTAGWTLTPRTRLYCNYFMIRDQLARNVRLNTVIHSIGGGIQQDIPVTSRGNLQVEFQFRELYQLHQQSVFDFLPGLTFSYVLTPRIVIFANTLLQLRSKAFFQAPTKEIDPFYTWGGLFQKNGWTFSASTTLVQNFREPFRRNATIPVNNYSFICDFEISRRVLRELPGLQAFVRAEPIYNFHSHNRPGLAGMDFRMFWGLRMALAKPALTAALEQLRQQLEEQEALPPSPEEKKDGKPKPSAFIPPHEVIASSPQPMHGFINEVSGAEVAVDHIQNKAVELVSYHQAAGADQELVRLEAGGDAAGGDKDSNAGGITDGKGNEEGQKNQKMRAVAEEHLQMVLVPPFPSTPPTGTAVPAVIPAVATH